MRTDCGAQRLLRRLFQKFARSAFVSHLRLHLIEIDDVKTKCGFKCEIKSSPQIAGLG